MKIAAIIITYNDGYKIKEWRRWYEEYKDEVAKLIIVDNGSEDSYLNQVEESFNNATIIKRKTNGGCTAAYNDGIRTALKDANVTHIALIGNDIRIQPGTLTKCVEFIDSDNSLGMVAPVLLYADSNVVCDFGCEISDDLTMIPYGKGENLEELKENYRYCDAVTGGMNIAKRSFYEKIGLQDENLFMYSDEVDMALRSKKKNIRIAATKEGKAWHQHIAPPAVVKRHPYSFFLIARNKVYLAYKHYGKHKAREVFKSFYVEGIKHYFANLVKLNFDRAQCFRWGMIGAYHGLRQNMAHNKYSHL